MHKNLVITILLSLIALGQVHAIEFNPLSYGLKDAKNGVERYQSLLRCHEDAVKKGAKVSYRGIDTIKIEIPHSFKTIPLTSETDFAGCVITVVNRAKNVFLFSMVNKVSQIVVPASCIDKAQFEAVPELSKGNHLLSISDKNKWVSRRLGHDYGHIRKDVVLITDGKGSNKPVMPYDNPNSIAECEYCEVSLSEKVIENLVFLRDSQSTKNCNLCDVKYQNNVLIRNISVKTPSKTGILADRLFRIQNSTNITFENLRIQGTYSDVRKYGYAFNMNNVWNHVAKNVYADAIWGVYGNNNINTATLMNCNLNNFEIHCYGRDITSRNCTYHDYYNHFASTYGTIKYENCVFTNTIPHMNANSYNSYVPVDVEFTNCMFNIMKNRKITSFAMIYGLTDSINHRPELSKKCLPNFRLRHCTFNIDKNVKNWYFINFMKVDYKKNLGYMSKISLSDITINGDAEFDLFTCPIETEKPVDVEFDNINIVNKGRKRKLEMLSATMGRRMKFKVNGKKVRERKFIPKR